MKNSEKPTCGDFGGHNKQGEPCGYVAGWGTDFEEGKCKKHRGTSPDGESHEGNQNAMKTGLQSDPVNLFNWLTDNHEEAAAWILNKLYDYSQRAPHAVYEASFDAEDIDTFEDVEVNLTSYGDDVLMMCIRDFARWKATKRQLQEGVISEQEQLTENGVWTTEDANPVNLELDRMDRTTMKQKDKLGLLPSPESAKAEATETLAEVLSED